MLQQQLLLVDQKLDLAKEAACRRQKLLNQETQQVVCVCVCVCVIEVDAISKEFNKAVAAFPDQQKLVDRSLYISYI